MGVDVGLSGCVVVGGCGCVVWVGLAFVYSVD